MMEKPEALLVPTITLFEVFAHRFAAGRKQRHRAANRGALLVASPNLI